MNIYQCHSHCRSRISCNITRYIYLLYQGKGKVIVVGVGPDARVSINFLPLLMGRTLKGTIFGGIKPRSHLPLLLDRCKKKVRLRIVPFPRHFGRAFDRSLRSFFAYSVNRTCAQVIVRGATSHCFHHCASHVILRVSLGNARKSHLTSS